MSRTGGRCLVGDGLNDYRALGQQFAVVEAERRHLALRIDLQVVVAVLELLGPQIDLDQIVGQTRFQKCDMG